EDGIRAATVTGVQTCALPILVALGVDRLGEVDDQLRLAEQRVNTQPRRQQRESPEDEPRRDRCAQRGAEHAELRLLELLPLEREIGRASCRERGRTRWCCVCV